MKLSRIFSFNQSMRDQWVANRTGALISSGKVISVLDVGAGTGRYRNLFPKTAYKAHDFGEEPSTQGIYTELDYVSDITRIPVPDKSFDVILCTEVLEHVPDPVAAIYEMARIIKPGGRLLLTAPLASFLHQEPFHFYGGFTPHFYNFYLPKCGFRRLKIESNNGFFSFFGQEAGRFSTLIDPKSAPRNVYWPLLVILWSVTYPFFRFFLPIVGFTLDKLGLEKIATVGYHVEAVMQDANDREVNMMPRGISEPVF